MKVLITNPPWIIDRGFTKRLGVRAGSRWPFTIEAQRSISIPSYLPFPFFLAYAAAVLEKNDFDVLLIDAIAEEMNNDEFVKKIKEYKPDLVLLETSTPSIDIDLAMAKRIKDEIKDQSRIALCGPHVSVLGEEVLKENNFIDYILVGEYEYTLLDLVRGSNMRDILGLIYRQGNKIQVNPRRPVIEDLDELPWPARHFLPMDKYSDAFCGLPLPSLQIWASRGCPYKCIFCMWPEVMYGGHRYRARDPVKVVDEIEWCIQEYGFKSIYFDDDIFNIGKDRILRLSQEMKRRIRLPWGIMARADTMDREMLETMSENGLYALKYGVESGTQEILNRSGKDLDLNKVTEMVKFAKEFGIKVHLTFTFGLPGETKETIQKTINYAAELDPDSVQFSLVTPFPGTRYFEMADKEGFLVSKNWTDYDGARKSVIRTNNLSAEDLKEALCLAMKRFQKARFKRKKVYYLRKGIQHPLIAIRRVYEYLNA